MVDELYPKERDHILDCFAQRRQRPHEKINHAIVLGGGQGIGKDTLVLGVKQAVGGQNFRVTSPDVIVGSQFNPEYKSVVLYISEAHDLGLSDRIKFYNVIKDKLASPPMTIRVNEKHRKAYYIANLCFVIMTTNYRTGGIYLPPDDRRHMIAWTDVQKGNHTKEWWDDYYGWFYREGAQNIAAFLQARDLSKFNPKAEPPKTEAWHAMVNASRSSEEMELVDVLSLFDGGPVTLSLIIEAAQHLGYGNLADWLSESRNSKAAVHRLEEAGYTTIRNTDDTRGRWRVLQRDKSTRPKLIFGPATGMTEDERRAAARLFKDKVEAFVPPGKEPGDEQIPF